MPTVAVSVPQDQKHRVRAEAKQTARDLIAADNIEEAEIRLADYHQRFGNNPDAILRFGIAFLFMLDLMRECFSWQTHRVSQVLDAHLEMLGSAEHRRSLRRCERRMYRRFGVTKQNRQFVVFRKGTPP